MNKHVAKTLIFMAGAAVGAVISAFATKKVVEKAYWDECDKELNEQSLRHKDELKAYKDEIEELKSTISQQNVAIAVLGKKVSEEVPVENEEKSSEDDSEDDPRTPKNTVYERERARYWSEDDEAEEVADDDEDYDSEEVEYDERNDPYVIDRLLYETSALSFAKEDATYYIYDGKVIDASGEWMDKYEAILGNKWLEGNHKNGDTVYVRNEYYCTDYEIEFIADYGERHMNVCVSEDDWGD